MVLKYFGGGSNVTGGSFIVIFRPFDFLSSLVTSFGLWIVILFLGELSSVSSLDEYSVVELSAASGTVVGCGVVGFILSLNIFGKFQFFLRLSIMCV